MDKLDRIYAEASIVLRAKKESPTLNSLDIPKSLVIHTGEDQDGTMYIYTTRYDICEIRKKDSSHYQIYLNDQLIGTGGFDVVEREVINLFLSYGI